jgi:TolB protein
MEMVRLTANGKSGRAAAISPDGRYVAHVLDEKGQQGLWLRQAATASDVEIVPPDTVIYDGLTFSRDGNYIYCTVTDKEHRPYYSLYRIPALGGLPKEKLLSDVDGPAAISPDGKQLAIGRSLWAEGSQSLDSLLLVANADGSGARVVARHTGPEILGWRGEGWSPDGKTIASCVMRHEGAGSAWVAGISPQGNPEGALSPPAWQVCQSAAWLPDGSAIVTTATTEVMSWSAGYQLWKVLNPSGQVTRISNDLSTYYGASLTADGSSLVTVQNQHASSIWLVSEGRPGARQLTTGGAGQDGLRGIAWTPDGRLIYFSVSSGRPQLWIMGGDGGNPSQFTNRNVMSVDPAASPDGGTVFFSSGIWGDDSVWKVDIDGSNLQQLTRENFAQTPDISPDGDWIVYGAERNGHMVVRRLDLARRQPIDLAAGSDPRISPDGRMVAFQYDDEKLEKTRLAVIPSGGGSRLFTLDFPRDPLMRGNGQVQWAPDGHALTYFDTNDGISNIWKQPLDGSAPRQLTHFNSDRIFSFAWSKDGRHLAVARGTVASDVVLVRNLH